MSYQEKKTIASLLTGGTVFVAYCVYAIGKYRSGTVGVDDLEFWAGAMLKFIAIGVAAAIIVQIVFHIMLSISVAVREKVYDRATDDAAIDKAINAEMVEDEMDRLIELKSMRVSFALAGIGFVVSLIVLVLGFSPALMLNIMFVSVCVGSLFEGLSQLYFYRRGIAHA